MKREAGLDLIRITGVLFVISVHHFLYNGFYSEPQTGLLMWAADSFRWLCFCCNGLFMMLTGYLKSQKRLDSRYYTGLVSLLVGYVLCCIVIFPLQSRLITEELTLAEWGYKLISFGNYAWYVEMYIGLILFSPVVNLALAQIKGKKALLGTVGILFVLTGLPSLTTWHIAPDYWTGIYPVTYYVLGAVIRRIQPDVKPWQGLGAAALICMGLGGMSVMTAEGSFSTGYTQGYGGFWTTMIALSVFLGLYRVKPGQNVCRGLQWLSGGCYEGFMLSLIPDLWAYKLLTQWHTPEKWPLLYVCVTVPIFVVSLLAGKLMHTLALRLTGLLPGFHESAAPKFKVKSGS